MKKKVLAVITAMILGGLGLVAPAFAESGTCPAGSKNSSYENSVAECNMEKTGNTGSGSLMSTLNVIINVVLGVLGFVTVVVIIIGGYMYVTSTGDAAKVTKAKNTIMYGVIGLVIALLAWAIVNFVLANVFG